MEFEEAMSVRAEVQAEARANRLQQEEDDRAGIRNLGEVLNAFQERLGEVEDKIDELLDLARSQGLVSHQPLNGPDSDPYWGDPYGGDGGL